MSSLIFRNDLVKTSTGAQLTSSPCDILHKVHLGHQRQTHFASREAQKFSATQNMLMIVRVHTCLNARGLEFDKIRDKYLCDENFVPGLQSPNCNAAAGNNSVMWSYDYRVSGCPSNLIARPDCSLKVLALSCPKRAAFMIISGRLTPNYGSFEYHRSDYCGKAITGPEMFVREIVSKCVGTIFGGFLLSKNSKKRH